MSGNRTMAQTREKRTTITASWKAPMQADDRASGSTPVHSPPTSRDPEQIGVYRLLGEGGGCIRPATKT